MWRIGASPIVPLASSAAIPDRTQHSSRRIECSGMSRGSATDKYPASIGMLPPWTRRRHRMVG